MKKVSLFAVILGLILVPSVGSAAVIWINPINQTHMTVDPTTVNPMVEIMVSIGPNENIYALTMDIAFDDSVIGANTNNGGPNLTWGTMFSLFGGINLQANVGNTSTLFNNLSGTLLFPNMVGIGPGVYTFAKILFDGVGYGTSPVSILNAQAADQLNRPVGLETIDGSVTIAIPEPATMAMIAAGVGALALRRRRRA